MDSTRGDRLAEPREAFGDLSAVLSVPPLWKKYQEKKEAQAAEEAERKAKRAERMKAEYEGQKAATEDTSESDTREDGTEDTHPDQSN